MAASRSSARSTAESTAAPSLVAGTAGATPRTLALVRHAFVAELNREVVGTERPRILAVLDALLGWSLARPTLLEFRSDGARGDIITFRRTGSNVVFWTARSRRGELPQLELLPRSLNLLSEDERSRAMNTLNAHQRLALEPDAPLRIGFGALKNTGARAAVLALMDQLLVVT